MASDGITPEMGKRVHEDGSRFDLCLSDDADFFPALREKLLLEKQIGLEYIDFHLRLPPRYLNSGGEYRDDAAYHRLIAGRIERIQSLCFELGLNCYFETHMNMISVSTQQQPYSGALALLPYRSALGALQCINDQLTNTQMAADCFVCVCVWCVSAGGPCRFRCHNGGLPCLL